MGRKYSVPKSAASSSIAPQKQQQFKRKKNADVYNQQQDSRELSQVKERRVYDQEAFHSSAEEDSDYNNDGPRINASDDEDISEDEAFNSEDEQRYGHYFEVTDKNVSDNEPSDFEQDADAIGLDQMLDASDNEPSNTVSQQENGLEVESDSVEDFEFSVSDQDESDITASESENEQGEQGAGMTAVLDKLDQFDAEHVDKPRQKSSKQLRRAQEITEQFEVDEFRLRANKSSTSTKLTIDQLMKGQVDEVESENQSEVSEDEKNAPLSVPLEPLHQTKLERVAAYKQTTEQISKWTPMIQHNKHAEHLQFPLKGTHGGTDGDRAQATGKSLVASYRPRTDMERDIDAILKKSKNINAEVDDGHIDLDAVIDKGEAEERRRELLKMRSLLFYSEIKAKRAAKIKSKKYRQVHRRERKREQQKLTATTAQAADK